jgi:hypothetical protein
MGIVDEGENPAVLHGLNQAHESEALECTQFSCSGKNRILSGNHLTGGLPSSLQQLTGLIVL